MFFTQPLDLIKNRMQLSGKLISYTLLFGMDTILVTYLCWSVWLFHFCTTKCDSAFIITCLEHCVLLMYIFIHVLTCMS